MIKTEAKWQAVRRVLTKIFTGRQKQLTLEDQFYLASEGPFWCSSQTLHFFSRYNLILFFALHPSSKTLFFFPSSFFSRGSLTLYYQCWSLVLQRGRLLTLSATEVFSPPSTLQQAEHSLTTMRVFNLLHTRQIRAYMCACACVCRAAQ